MAWVVLAKLVISTLALVSGGAGSTSHRALEVDEEVRFSLSIPFFARDSQVAAPPSSMAQEMFDAQNVEREKEGLAPYRWDDRAGRAAQARADDLVERDYFAHSTPEGLAGYTEALKEQQVTNFRWAGENLAANSYPLSEAVARSITSLMNSPTHRANILDEEFDSCGVGYAERPTKVHVFAIIFLAGAP